MEIRQAIHELVKKNKIDKALDLLSAHFEEKSPALYQDTIILSQRYEQMNRDYRLKVLSYDERLNQQAQILDHIMQLTALAAEGNYPGNNQPDPIKEPPEPDPVNNKNVVTELDGLKAAESVMIQKLNYLRSRMATLADPAQKFQLTMQIQEAEKELDELREKMESLSK